MLFSRSILFLAAIAVLIVAVAAVIYKAVYRNRINRQLNSETARPRKMVSPLTFALITAFAVLLAFAGLATVSAMLGNRDRGEADYSGAVVDFQTYNPDQMTGYRAAYSIDENPGFTKQVEQRGDIRFTSFVRDDAFDSYHPTFLVFVEYTGDKEILYYGFWGEVAAADGTSLGGYGHAGSVFSDSLCVIGTSSIQSRFELTVYLYDSELKGQDMGDTAAVSETLVLLTPFQ